MATNTKIPSSNTSLNLASYTNIPASVTSLNNAAYTNIPATTSFTPSSVTGLELWLDGRDLVGADGTAITTWTKRAGTSGTDASQAAAGLKPIIKSGGNGLNGNPVARFDGSNDMMLATLDAGSTGFTIYFVGRTGGALTAFGTVVGSGGSVAGGSANPTTGVDWAFAEGSSGTFGAGWAGPDESVALGAVSGIAINTAFRSRYRTNKVAWSISGPNNGTPADTSFPTATFQVHIACASVFAGAAQFPFNGDIACILIYSAAVSASDDTAIASYLQTTWGV